MKISSETKVTLATLVVFTSGILLTMLLNSAECTAKTRRIGMAHDWTMMGGCMIEVEPNIWIPLSIYRR